MDISSFKTVLVLCSRPYVSLCAPGGLLLCYDLPPHTDRQGRPMNRLLVNRSHSYQQTLANLIHEVGLSFRSPPFPLLRVGFKRFVCCCSCVGEHPAVWLAPGTLPAPGMGQFHESSFLRCLTGLCSIRHQTWGMEGFGGIKSHISLQKVDKCCLFTSW